MATKSGAATRTRARACQAPRKLQRRERRWRSRRVSLRVCVHRRWAGGARTRLHRLAGGEIRSNAPLVHTLT
jgi:hypothetical protein